ncbi:MAG TPA: serine O-acetyltransferase EpsC [Anaerolineales bacterium]|nr:serine O-acetyltransferase EpsC [Anaerolineales bacterium]
MFDTIREDIQSVVDRDPAARSTLEILICYPGLHAIWAHRVSNWLWRHGIKLFARWLSQITRGFTGIEIHPGATIGRKLFIDHGMGVVIGETAEVGDCVTLYHNVTLGGTSLEKTKRHPTIEDHVVIGAGAKVLGAITIGAHSRIGANAVVVKSAPQNSVVVGVPGQIVVRDQKLPTAEEKPDLEHDRLPDTIVETLTALIAHVESLEKRVNGGGEYGPALHAPEKGVWHAGDFSI